VSRERGTILVGYDGSPEADLALQWAAETAALDGRPVRSVTVDNRESSRYAPQAPVSKDQITARVDAILQAAGVSGTVDVHSGHAVSVLLRNATRTDLLVVGSRGLGRAAETLLGSVSQHLVRHAPCPVVVMRAPARPDVARIVVGVDGSDESLAALEFACRRATLTKESVVALHAGTPIPCRRTSRGRSPKHLPNVGRPPRHRLPST
jgi:nucleotide-binding universal stress UspA family protein